VYLSLASISILKYILNRWHAFSEEWKAKFFKLGTGNVDVEVFTFGKSLAVNFRLMSS